MNESISYEESYDPWDAVDAALDAGTDPVAAHDAARADAAVGAWVRSSVNRVARPSIPHGTYAGYKHHRCRCSRCRGAYAIQRRRERANARSLAKTAN